MAYDGAKSRADLFRAQRTARRNVLGPARCIDPFLCHFGNAGQAAIDQCNPFVQRASAPIAAMSIQLPERGINRFSGRRAPALNRRFRSLQTHRPPSLIVRPTCIGGPFGGLVISQTLESRRLDFSRTRPVARRFPQTLGTWPNTKFILPPWKLSFIILAGWVNGGSAVLLMVRTCGRLRRLSPPCGRVSTGTPILLRDGTSARCEP